MAMAASGTNPVEPIAIIGMGCRFPGGADSPAAFWELLAAGTDAVVEVPGDRWNTEAWYDPNPIVAGKMSTKWGGFLAGIDMFDHAFFGMANREASSLDPQHRLLVEVAWQAFEDAGCAVDGLVASRTGVYMGVFGQDFQSLLTRDPANINAYTPTGNVLCVGVNRISNYFDLYGPSMAIDTGCSSSLVAVHQACQSLRTGEIDLALAGGVNVVLAPEPVVALSKAWMMAADGRCKAFDEAADGYVRGEGCGMVVLKRLRDAERDGDRVLAVVRGSAVNQDGRGQGLTAPNPLAQTRVVTAALAAAGVAPGQLAYVEAHGSGTALGDPIEIEALTKAFGDVSSGSCPIGSVKTNIGHLETAAGIAGLIKTVLVLRHGQVPPHLHLRTPNPAIPFARTPFTVATSLTPLRASAGPRIAGVSSFGLGGTNAHAIVEAGPGPATTGAAGAQVLVLSAKSETALAALAALHVVALAALPAAQWAPWCRAAARRTSHAHRMAVVAEGPQAAREALRTLSASHTRLSVATGPAELAAAATAFVGGDPLDMACCFATPTGPLTVDLPTYPFQRERAWFGPAMDRQPAAAGAGARWSAASPAWMSDHRVDGQVVAPASAWLAWALAAAQPEPGAVTLADWRFHVPLTLGNEPTSVTLGAAGGHLQALSGAGTVHAEGDVRRTPGGAPVSEGPLALMARLPVHLPGADFYARLAEHGLAFGPAFRSHEAFWRSEGEALARLAPCAADQALAAPRLDAWLQAVGAALPEAAWRTPTAWVPTALDSLTVWGDPAPARWVHARVAARDASGGSLSGDLVLLDDAGRVCAQVRGLRLQAVGAPVAAPAAASGAVAQGLFTVAWEQQPAGAAMAGPGSWLLVGGGAAADGLVAALAAAGGKGLRLSDGSRGAIAGALAQGGPWRGVVGMGALDGDPADPVAAAHAAAAAAMAVLHGLGDSKAGPRAVLVTAGAVSATGAVTAPAQATVWGLARVAAQELPAARVLSLDLGPAGAAELAALVQELALDGPEDQVAVAGDRRWVARLRRVSAALRQPYRVVVTQPGSLANLASVPAARPAPGPGQVEVAVEAAGLNFRDVMHAMGVYPGDPIALGAEGAGRITRVGPGVTHVEVGMNVLGLLPGALASHSLTDARLVCERPAGLSVVAAAGFTVTFLTAHYALGHLGRLAAGERVLIHAAAGGVGLAAIALARRAGATIFATAGSPEKRSFLRGLGISHVYDSRTLDFVDEIRADTGGEGVDVVLNSLTGAYIPASLGLLRVGGRFLEIGKHDIYDDGSLALGAFRRNLTYQSIDLDLMSRHQPALVQALFADLMAMVAGGELALHEPRTFGLDALAEGFGHLRGRTSIGKIVFTLPAIGEQAATGRPGGSYLVTGGLGALGLATAEWLARQGAGHLALTGRRAPDADAARRIAALQEQGVTVVVVQADVSRAADVARVLAGVAAPLTGIFHLAGVLDDGVLARQTPERLAAVLAPKVAGAWHLHAQTRELPLDCFVIFSSVASVLGPAGQGTYAAANGFLDALAHHRRLAGLPAQSIGWGPWAAVGMAAVHADRLAALGFGAWGLEAGFAQLAEVWQSGGTHVVAIDLDPPKWLASAPKLRAWPFLAELSPSAPAPVAPGGEGWSARIAGVTAAEQAGVVERLVAGVIATILGRPATDVAPTLPLADQGLDSLLALELRSRLGLETGLSLPPTLMWTYPTVDALAKYLVTVLAGPAAAPAAAAATLPTVPAAMTAAEAEAALLAELDSLSSPTGYAR